MGVARTIGRWLVRIVVLIVVIALGVVIWAQFSPRPGAFIIKKALESGTSSSAEKLEKHRPTGVVSTPSVRFGDASEETLDAYWPEGTTGALPTVVWCRSRGRG